MDKQLIQRLAREAGFLIDGAGNAYVGVPGYGASELRGGELLQRFATRVAEECAKIAADHAHDAQDAPFKAHENNHPDGYADASNDIEAAIREEFKAAEA
jgi:hypothetical protein